MRRLKKKNYGKWFLQPKDFNYKVKRLNRTLDKHGTNPIVKGAEKISTVRETNPPSKLQDLPLDQRHARDRLVVT